MHFDDRHENHIINQWAYFNIDSIISDQNVYIVEAVYIVAPVFVWSTSSTAVLQSHNDYIYIHGIQEQKIQLLSIPTLKFLKIRVLEEVLRSIQSS